jgi:hypothetical protein
MDGSNACAAPKSLVLPTVFAASTMKSATSFAVDPVTTSIFSYPPPSISPSRPHCDAHHAGRMISKAQPACRTAIGTRRDRTQSMRLPGLPVPPSGITWPRRQRSRLPKLPKSTKDMEPDGPDQSTDEADSSCAFKDMCRTRLRIGQGGCLDGILLRLHHQPAIVRHQ